MIDVKPQLMLRGSRIIRRQFLCYFSNAQSQHLVSCVFKPLKKVLLEALHPKGKIQRHLDQIV